MEIDEAAPHLDLSMDRPLFNPPFKAQFDGNEIVSGDPNFSSDALFDQIYVDRLRLEANIRWMLQTKPQISLSELLKQRPLEQGLAEVITYMSLAAERPASLIDDTSKQTIYWTDKDGNPRQATVPLILFCRAVEPVLSSQ